MTKKEVNLAIINGLKSKEINIAEIELNHLEAFADIMHKAMDYTRCCESDSELLHKLLQYLSDEDELIGNRTHQQIIDNFKKLV